MFACASLFGLSHVIHVLSHEIKFSDNEVFLNVSSALISVAALISLAASSVGCFAGLILGGSLSMIPCGLGMAPESAIISVVARFAYVFLLHIA